MEPQCIKLEDLGPLALPLLVLNFGLVIVICVGLARAAWLDARGKRDVRMSPEAYRKVLLPLLGSFCLWVVSYSLRVIGSRGTDSLLVTHLEIIARGMTSTLGIIAAVALYRLRGPMLEGASRRRSGCGATSSKWADRAWWIGIVVVGVGFTGASLYRIPLCEKPFQAALACSAFVIMGVSLRREAIRENLGFLAKTASIALVFFGIVQLGMISPTKPVLAWAMPLLLINKIALILAMKGFWVVTSQATQTEWTLKLSEQMATRTIRVVAEELHGVAKQNLHHAEQVATPEQAREFLRKAREAVDTSLYWLCNLRYERPPANLALAVNKRRAELEAKNIELVFAQNDVLPPEIERVFEDVAGEALSNVARHSGATTASVQVDVRDRVAELHVSDNGCGIKGPRKKSSFGIQLMRAAADPLGGAVLIQSDDQRGTTVSCTVELRGVEGEHE